MTFDQTQLLSKKSASSKATRALAAFSEFYSAFNYGPFYVCPGSAAKSHESQFVYRNVYISVYVSMCHLIGALKCERGSKLEKGTA